MRLREIPLDPKPQDAGTGLLQVLITHGFARGTIDMIWRLGKGKLNAVRSLKSRNVLMGRLIAGFLMNRKCKGKAQHLQTALMI